MNKFIGVLDFNTFLSTAATTLHLPNMQQQPYPSRESGDDRPLNEEVPIPDVPPFRVYVPPGPDFCGAAALPFAAA